MAYVYLLSTKCNRVYVGSTGELLKRIDRHMNELRLGKHHNANLQEIYNAGTEMSLSTIRCVDRDQAYALEKRFIDDLSGLGIALNIGIGVRGGDNLSLNPRREDILKRMTETLRGTLSAMSPEDKQLKWGKPGKLNPMYGRSHTDEVKERLSKATRGNKYALGAKRSEEHRRRLSKSASERLGTKNPFYGRKHTIETKARISEARMGNLPVNTNRISVNGVVYKSQADASRQLKVSGGTITFRLNSKNPKFSEYKVI